MSNTLWARLETNGRLVVGAVAKHQPPHPHPAAQSSLSTAGTEAPASTAAGGEGNDRERDRDDAASVNNAVATSFPPEAAAAQCPDILITCPGAVPTDDNGFCSPACKE